MDKETWVIDRLEGPLAILISDSGEEQQVEAALLQGAAEGAVFDVPVSDGVRDWANAAVNSSAAQARQSEGQDILNQLKSRGAPAQPDSVPGPLSRKFL